MKLDVVPFVGNAVYAVVKELAVLRPKLPRIMHRCWHMSRTWRRRPMILVLNIESRKLRKLLNMLILSPAAVKRLVRLVNLAVVSLCRFMVRIAHPSC